MKLKYDYPEVEIRVVEDSLGSHRRVELVQRWGNREHTVWIPTKDVVKFVKVVKEGGET